MKSFAFIIFFVATLTGVHAQKRTNLPADSTKKTVVITSAYKPSVRPASKINFSAATPAVDTTRPRLQYNVPAQNLFFTYQPASLKPLALSIDTGINWQNENFIKVGAGNFSTPFLQAGISLGDGTGSMFNIHTKHISQKGKLPFQQYSHSNADLIGTFNQPGSNTEFRAKVGFDKFTTYQYGYRPDNLQFTKDQLRNSFTTFNIGSGFRNKTVNAYGISYNPSVDVNFFQDNNKGKETTVLVNSPLSKTFGKVFGFNLGFVADVTTLKRFDGSKTKNNLYYITPEILFKSPNFNFTGGFIPSWDNQKFNLLPNFNILVKMKDERFVLQGGWKGYYQKNTYQSLATFNPWINQPADLLNTRIKEQYAGFKGSAGSHLTYNARVAYLNYSNAALLANDNIDGKSFVTLYEPEMKALRLHGEVGYTVQEKFSLLAGATISQYTGLQNNAKAWGLLPLEVTGSLRWQVLKDLQFKTDLFAWDGARYRNKAGSDQKSKAAFDLNTGVEFTVMPKLNLWVQFNNVFNNRYQRWNQYEVLGFNVLGGIVYSFAQTGK